MNAKFLEDLKHSGSAYPQRIELEEAQELTDAPLSKGRLIMFKESQTDCLEPQSISEQSAHEEQVHIEPTQPPQNEEEEQMKNIPYASAIGSLLYAQVCTRLDIAMAVEMLGRYQSNPGMEHWKAAKKVMRYLQGTKDYGLTFRHTDHLEVVGYSNSDFAGCANSRKSTSGYIFQLAGGAISWRREE
ncbi:secreted RxLR effector protein 161-like [Alnus glutinosa]|uniref:secreted RxLR effector protein 161-like n=1 Tax=Alnus glutinosa TaxID=3517 RepID=UPI002D78DCD2|nr:secreted RxLR effector protein 161-like [Alnus glutinosa]